MSLDLNLNRRNFLIPMAGILVAPTLVSCLSMDRKTKFSANINKKVHWARRENWTGPEYVVGVAGMGDRYLMVKKRSSGWDFPGGPVVAKAHGKKSDENKDITFAVASYFNSQALISQRLGEAELFAYGFMINPATNENYLVHWFSMGMPQTFPTDPSPNLTETLDAKWATIDDPVIGKCLRMRIQEYTDAAEGGSVLKQSCFDYSVQLNGDRKMNESQQNNEQNNEEQYESYGWEFHKYPLLYAGIMTAVFYAFIFIYFNMD